MRRSGTICHPCGRPRSNALHDCCLRLTSGHALDGNQSATQEGRGPLRVLWPLTRPFTFSEANGRLLTLSQRNLKLHHWGRAACHIRSPWFDWMRLLVRKRTSTFRKSVDKLCHHHQLTECRLLNIRRLGGYVNQTQVGEILNYQC